MKNLDDFLKDYEGYKKIRVDCGSLLKCYLYNPDTMNMDSFIVDDREYEYGNGMIDWRYNLSVLEYIRFNMRIDEVAYQHYCKYVLGQIMIGDMVEVIKGRKFPIGMKCKVIDKFRYNIPQGYGRYVDYAILECGQKININNLKSI